MFDIIYMLVDDFHTMTRRGLVKLARLHPKNRNPDRPDQWDYPQLWYCWPKSWKRKTLRRRVGMWACGVITGHEISATERGYGGGKFIDCNCRWCDKVIKVPIAEAALEGPLSDLVNRFGDMQGEDIQ